MLISLREGSLRASSSGLLCRWIFLPRTFGAAFLTLGVPSASWVMVMVPGEGTLRLRIVGASSWSSGERNSISPSSVLGVEGSGLAGRLEWRVMREGAGLGPSSERTRPKASSLTLRPSPEGVPGSLSRTECVVTGDVPAELELEGGDEEDVDMMLLGEQRRDVVVAVIVLG